MGGSRQIKLGAFLQANGNHTAAWRHPDADAAIGVNFARYKQMAQMAEAAKFDMIFLADGVAVRENTDNIETLKRSGRAVSFEPITLYSALAAVTRNIGFVATASTTYYEPYHVARLFGSLDHISGGRAGWNVVTSWSDAEALNFGRDSHLEHATRYRRAHEFVDVVTGLWDSWEDDAFLRDKQSGIFLDPEKLHVLNYKGEFLRVKGPLNVARPPQGYPVIVQAGSSNDGQELAARTSEVIFTAQQTLADAQAFYRGLKGRLAKYGRTPDQLLVMPGIFPVVGRTQREAQDKFDVLQNLIAPEIGLNMLRNVLPDMDLSKLDIDQPLPKSFARTNGSTSRQELLIELAERENLTVRQLFLRIAGGRGHWSLIGTPESIVDQLEEWFQNEAADGFNVLIPWMPGGLTDFVELVLPELRRRGLFRTEYEGSTLRENLGLRRPDNQHVGVDTDAYAYVRGG